MLDSLKGLRDHQAVEKVTSKIHHLTAEMGSNGRGKIRLMHLCGTHEQAIHKHALRPLLPDNLEILPGPGCPVCVCPAGAVDLAIELSEQKSVTLLTFGDMLKVFGSKGSLAEAKARGASVKILYSPIDAIALAEKNQTQEFVFFAVGFETTTMGIANMVKMGLPKNLTLLMACRFMPPALRFMMEHQKERNHNVNLEGFILPGHAAVVTGLPPYQFMSDEYQLPAVIAGFEPLDLLLAILDLLEQTQMGTHQVKNLYPRAVRDAGNHVAIGLLGDCFDLTGGYWRGIGEIPFSCFELKPEFAERNALHRFQLTMQEPVSAHPKGCICNQVLLGEANPIDCIHFGKSCHPENPFGPCMVSDEGTCHSWYRYQPNHQPK